MAKQTRKEAAPAKGARRPATPSRAASSTTGDTSELAPGETLAPQLISLRGYLLMNAAFAGFCILQLLFIRFTLNESRGLYFFFGLLIIGFAVVSAYDYIYDRMAGPETEE